MARVEQSIDVNVPLSAAYNQWTQFEDFPRFMDGVREVRQLDDAHLHWRAHRHGREVEWDSEIVEQIPDRRIDWRDTSGPRHSGCVEFQPLAQDKTRVRVMMEFDPQASPDASGPQELAERVGQDLERFKDLIEGQGSESGAWRGEIHGARSMGGSAGSGVGQAGVGERTVGQTESEKVEGGSSSHPSGRWESWTDETAFGSSTASGNGYHPGGGSATGGSGREGAGSGSAGAGSRREGGAGARGYNRDSARNWLRNQFPGLEEPMGVMRRMSEEMDQLFERFVGRPIASRFGQGQGGMAGKWMPQVEIVQLADALVVSVDLPGVKRSDVELQVLHDRLTVEGERHEETRGNTREGYRRSERCYGRFYRMIPLPHGVDPDQASAQMHDGVLEVRIPMPGAARQARKVDIH